MMSKTAHGNLILDGCHQLLKSDPSAVGILLEYCQKLKTNQWPKLYVDACFQDKIKQSSSFNLYTAYGFSLIHGLILSGQVGMAFVNVGAVPGANNDKEGNNQKLHTLLPKLSAHFDGAVAHPNDGWVTWNTGLDFEFVTMVMGNNGPEIKEKRRKNIKQGRVPLEVGSTYASCTLAHIKRDGGVARWPYYSPYMVLFLWTE